MHRILRFVPRSLSPRMVVVALAVASLVLTLMAGGASAANYRY